MPVNVGNSKLTVKIISQDDFTLGAYTLDWSGDAPTEDEIRTLVILNLTDTLVTFTISFINDTPDMDVLIPGLMQKVISFEDIVTDISTDCVTFLIDIRRGTV